MRLISRKIASYLVAGSLTAAALTLPMSASASSYAMVFQAVDDFPLQPVIGVRYRDRFDKVGDEWRFAERRIIGQLFGDLSRHLLREI